MRTASVQWDLQSLTEGTENSELVEWAEGERARDICPAARILKSSSTEAYCYGINNGLNKD